MYRTTADYKDYYFRGVTDKGVVYEGRGQGANRAQAACNFCINNNIHGDATEINQPQGASGI